MLSKVTKSAAEIGGSGLFAAVLGVSLATGATTVCAQQQGAAFDFKDPLVVEPNNAAEERGDYRPRYERELGNANETRNTGAFNTDPGGQPGDVNSLNEEMEGRGGLVPFFQNTFRDR